MVVYMYLQHGLWMWQLLTLVNFDVSLKANTQALVSVKCKIIKGQ